MSRVYLLESESGLVLVDAGPPGFELQVLRRMRYLRRNDLRLIFISHAHVDHYGSAAALRRLTGAQIAVHPSDAEEMTRGGTSLGTARARGRLVSLFFPLLEQFFGLEPTRPNLLLADGDTLGEFGLDAVVVHTPGHTPGSSSLLVERRMAFVGDLISTGIRPHAQRYFAHDWSLIPLSLARLATFNPAMIYTGHGPFPLNGGRLRKLASEYR